MSGEEEDPLIILFKNFFRTKCLLMNLYMMQLPGMRSNSEKIIMLGSWDYDYLPITFCSGAFDGIRFLLFSASDNEV